MLDLVDDVAHDGATSFHRVGGLGVPGADESPQVVGNERVPVGGLPSGNRATASSGASCQEHQVVGAVVATRLLRGGSAADAVVDAGGGVRPDRGQGVAQQHRVSTADGPHHAGGWVDVHHRHRHPGAGGVDHGGVVGGQVFCGVRVDPLPAGFADVVRQGEDPLQGWGAEPGRVLVGGGVEVEGPVASGGYRGDVEPDAGAGFQAAEVAQVGRGGRGVAAVGDVAGVVQRPV